MGTTELELATIYAAMGRKLGIYRSSDCFHWEVVECMCVALKVQTTYFKCFILQHAYCVKRYACTTELDRENPDFPPCLISHGQKIRLSRVLLATRSEVADCVCVALPVWSMQCGRNISSLEVAQSYLVSLRALFGKDPTRPNLLHNWRCHYTWRYRESGFSLYNSVACM